MEIGQILKETRESQQLSIEAIQEKTKIQKRYLQAIENNDFGSLPGRFYARAFIKEYALALNLDPESLLQQFDKSNHAQQEEMAPYTPLKRSRRVREPRSSTILSFLPTVIVILLIVAILFVAWIFIQKSLSSNSDNFDGNTDSDEIIRDVNERPNETQDDENLIDDDTETPEQQDEVEQKEDEFSVVEVGQGRSPQSTLEFLAYRDSVIITFDVTADTYVALSGSSGTTYFDGLLRPGVELEDLDVSNEEQVYFNIGNAAGLTVYFNDVALEYPINATEVVHQKLIIQLLKEQ